MKKSLAALGALCMLSAGAQAGEIYGNIGLPGVMLGYAQPIGPNLTLRGDIATLGRHDKDGREEGIDYTGRLKAQRAGLFADWFPSGSGSGFRLTGGVTFNDVRADLQGRGNGGTINIGGRDYVTGPDDRFDVKIEFPRTTPYLGIGWGHPPSTATGWGFVFDLGASIGKAKVRGSVSGPNLSGRVSQADIDRELEELRDGAGKLRALPQLSVGLSYRF